MDILRAEKLAIEKMAEHGLSDWSFSFDDSVQRRGVCHHAEKKICLSLELTRIRTEEAVINTILHEIAHALTPGSNHGQAWLHKAVSIGCDGTRCSTDGAAIQAPFIGICPGCGKRIERHRQKNISCSKCSSGVYNRKYRFKWSRVG